MYRRRTSKRIKSIRFTSLNETEYFSKNYVFYKFHKTPVTINFLNSGKEDTEVYFSKIRTS